MWNIRKKVKSKASCGSTVGGKDNILFHTDGANKENMNGNYDNKKSLLREKKLWYEDSKGRNYNFLNGSKNN
jgi:hypothetical protein